MSDEEPDQLTADLEEQVENMTFKPAKKRVLSEDALKKLAVARKKALEVRKANFEKKKQAKEDLKEAQVRTKIAKEDTKNKKKQELDELVDIADKELSESKKKSTVISNDEEDEVPVKKAKPKSKSKKTRIVINNDSESSSDDDTPQIYIRTKKKKSKPKPTAVTHEQVVQDYMPTVPIQEVQQTNEFEQPPPVQRQQPYWMDFR